MSFNIRIEPYRTKAIDCLRKDNLYFKGRILCGFSTATVYYVAKSTGLKSKKRRAIIKRFRKAILECIKRGTKYQEKLNE